MSDPTLSDIDFKNKIALVWTTLKIVRVETNRFGSVPGRSVPCWNIECHSCSIRTCPDRKWTIDLDFFYITLNFKCWDILLRKHTCCVLNIFMINNLVIHIHNFFVKNMDFVYWSAVGWEENDSRSTTTPIQKVKQNRPGRNRQKSIKSE